MWGPRPSHRWVRPVTHTAPACRVLQAPHTCCLELHTVLSCSSPASSPAPCVCSLPSLVSLPSTVPPAPDPSTTWSPTWQTHGTRPSWRTVGDGFFGPHVLCFLLTMTIKLQHHPSSVRPSEACGSKGLEHNMRKGLPAKHESVSDWNQALYSVVPTAL